MAAATLVTSNESEFATLPVAVAVTEEDVELAEVVAQELVAASDFIWVTREPTLLSIEL